MLNYEKKRNHIRKPFPKVAKIKYLGGMASVAGPSEMNMKAARPSNFAGLRLTNKYAVDCFINSPVNMIVTNDIMMAQINNTSAICQTNTAAISIGTEIRRLVGSKTEIQDVRKLKDLLHVHFPHKPEYGTDQQAEASNPFMDIVQCFPNLSKHLIISMKATTKCQHCAKETVKIDNENAMIQLQHTGRKPVQLQAKIDEWCTKNTEFKKRCQCQVTPLHWNLDKDTEIPDTDHTKTFEVVKVPTLLYVNTRTMREESVPITVSERITINGTQLHLKSAMLYTQHDRTATSGHWRSLIKENESFILYDDAKDPEEIPTSRLKQLLTKASDLVYVAEQATDVASNINVAQPEPSPVRSITSSTPKKSATALDTQEPAAQDSAPCTPFKEMSLSSPAPKAVRKLNFDRTPEKQPFAIPLKSIAGKKNTRWLEMATVNQYICSSRQSITIDHVVTDVEDIPENNQGPWEYVNRRKVILYYKNADSPTDTVYEIRLDNLLDRGFKKLSLNMSHQSEPDDMTPKKGKRPSRSLNVSGDSTDTDIDSLPPTPSKPRLSGHAETPLTPTRAAKTPRKQDTTPVTPLKRLRISSSQNWTADRMTQCRTEIEEMMRASGENIIVVNIEPHNDSTKFIVHYHLPNDFGNIRPIALADLQSVCLGKRKLPKAKKYTWYSWLKFKQYATEEGSSVEMVLSDEIMFLKNQLQNIIHLMVL